MKHDLFLRRMTTAALLLAIALLLPFLTGQIPTLGKLLSPMHLPVLLAGLLLGPVYGAAVGVSAPLLRMALFWMPQFPKSLAMSVELAVYGAVCGLMMRILPKRAWAPYPALITAMLVGRGAYGLAMLLISGVAKTEYTLLAFWTTAFLETLPGIILQLALLPPLVYTIRRTRLGAAL